MPTRDQKRPHGSKRPERSGIRVEVANTEGKSPVDPGALAALVRRTLEHEGIRRARISLALVDDATIRRINKQHLDHDWPTDVISFGFSGPDSPELAGELVVSAEMARVTAEEIQADPAAELALYVVHGLLHLCGYDDGTEDEIRRMRRREDEVLSREGMMNTFSRVGRREGREQAPCSV